MSPGGEPATQTVEAEPATQVVGQPVVVVGSGRAEPTSGPPVVGTMRRLARNRKGVVGLTFLVVLLLVAVFGPFLVPYDPNEVHVAVQLAPPSSTYWLGTDEL